MRVILKEKANFHYTFTDRNKPLRPIRHKISIDSLHTGVDEKGYAPYFYGSILPRSV
jgi:hypothetical protein